MKDKLFTKRLEIRLTPEIAEKLKKMADSHNTTISETIRIMIMKVWRSVK